MRNILNKKAQDMSVTTIIIIILAIVVLVFLIFSFTKSGGNLMDNIKNFFGGGSNIDSIKNACQTACITKSVYEFNEVKRDVKWDSSTRATATCKDLTEPINVNPKCIIDGTVYKDTKSKEDCIAKGIVWNKGSSGTESQAAVCNVNGKDKPSMLTKANCEAFAKYNENSAETTEPAVVSPCLDLA